MIIIYDAHYQIKEGGLCPLYCVTKEELNGSYELEMKHPYDESGKWKRIEKEKIIIADTPKGKQPFRIYNVQPTMESISVNARHIFYDLLDNFIVSLNSSGTASSAISAISSNMQYSTPFLFETDIETHGNIYGECINPVQALLDQSGDFASFVSVFGGELDRNGYKVRMLQSMGKDRGYRITYGKNLVGLEVTEDISTVVTRYYTIGKDGISGGYVDSDRINDYVNPKIDVYEDAEIESAEELRSAAKSMFDAGIDLPTVNIAVNFLLLQNTEEYKDYAVLEEVFLGDTVTVINQKMGFNKKAKVISYEYDAILKRYNKIELGDFLPTIYGSITSGESVAKTVATMAGGLSSHIARTDNPHKTTAEQLGIINRSTVVGQASNGSELTGKPWFKVATVSIDVKNEDRGIVFLVKKTYIQFTGIGILQCLFRTDNPITNRTGKILWLANNGLEKEDFVLAIGGDASEARAELWVKETRAWTGIEFDVLSEGQRINTGRYWTLANSGLTTGGYAQITEGFTQIVSV